MVQKDVSSQDDPCESSFITADLHVFSKFCWAERLLDLVQMCQNMTGKHLFSSRRCSRCEGGYLWSK